LAAGSETRACQALGEGKLQGRIGNTLQRGIRRLGRFLEPCGAYQPHGCLVCVGYVSGTRELWCAARPVSPLGGHITDPAGARFRRQLPDVLGSVTVRETEDSDCRRGFRPLDPCGEAGAVKLTTAAVLELGCDVAERRFSTRGCRSAVTRYERYTGQLGGGGL